MPKESGSPRLIGDNNTETMHNAQVTTCSLSTVVFLTSRRPSLSWEFRDHSNSLQQHTLVPVLVQVQGPPFNHHHMEGAGSWQLVPGTRYDTVPDTMCS